MNFLVQIQFLKSRSKNYIDVLRCAGLFDNFSAGERNVLTIESIKELFGRWDDFSVVIWNTTKWSGTNVYFCGSPVLPYTNDFFYRLMDVKTCYANYSRDISMSFCEDSDWGCHQLTNIGRYLDDGSYRRPNWFDFGKFKNKSTWEIDKEKLLLALNREAKIKMCDKCPAFIWSNICKKVNDLPDTINIEKNWRVTYRLDHDENGPVNVPAGILPIMGNMVEEEIPIQNDIDFENLTDQEVNDLIEKYLRGKLHL